MIGLLAEGKTIERVAAELGIGAGAVKTHLYNAKRNVSIADLRKREGRR